MDFNLNLTTTQVFGILFATGALILLLIVALRFQVHRAAKMNLSARYAYHDWSSPLEARTKYPDVDVTKYRPYAIYAGIIAALISVIALFNWTVTERVTGDFQGHDFVQVDFEITPPPTATPPPPPPPPPPPQLPAVIEVPEELAGDVVSPVFSDQSIEAESVVVEAPPSSEPSTGPYEYSDLPPAPSPPPVPPPPSEKVEEIFRVVEEMPRFPGCEDMASTQEEKRICAERALYEFIHTHLNYPAEARDNNIQGNVVVQFVVNTDGTVQDITILRDIGAGTGEEVVRVVNLMNTMNIRWIPGKQRGRPVRVIYILPVRFSLLVN